MDQCQRDAKWEVKIKTFDLALVRTHAEKLILLARWTGKLEQLFKEVPNHGYFQLRAVWLADLNKSAGALRFQTSRPSKVNGFLKQGMGFLVMIAILTQSWD